MCSLRCSQVSWGFYIITFQAENLGSVWHSWNNKIISGNGYKTYFKYILFVIYPDFCFKILMATKKKLLNVDVTLQEIWSVRDGSYWCIMYGYYYLQ